MGAGEGQRRLNVIELILELAMVEEHEDIGVVDDGPPFALIYIKRWGRVRRFTKKFRTFAANFNAEAMQKVCGTIGLFNAEGQCKPSAEPSSLELCRGAACTRPTGQYLPSARLLPLGQCKQACLGLAYPQPWQMSDIPINTQTISATGADHIVNIRADARKYTAFLANGQGRPHCFFIHRKR